MRRYLKGANRQNTAYEYLPSFAHLHILPLTEFYHASLYRSVILAGVSHEQSISPDINLRQQ